MADALNVMLVFVGSMIKEPLTGPFFSPSKVTSWIGLATVPLQRPMFAGINGVLKAAVKPVGVGVKALTVRPRVVIVLLEPTMAGCVAGVWLGVIGWLPPGLS